MLTMGEGELIIKGRRGLLFLVDEKIAIMD